MNQSSDFPKENPPTLVVRISQQLRLPQQTIKRELKKYFSNFKIEKIKKGEE